jgi:8-oxo-dGTP diphosphatase
VIGHDEGLPEAIAVTKRSASLSDVILAAGGIVWRGSTRAREIALIHRPKLDDWTLPKGKLDPGESWQEAALREVEEETGFSVQLGAFAGATSYLTTRAPKVVLYWHMELDGESDFRPGNLAEVDALEWLSVRAARRRLSFERDRRLLAAGTPSSLGASLEALGRIAHLDAAGWLRRLGRRSRPRSDAGEE